MPEASPSEARSIGTFKAPLRARVRRCVEGAGWRWLGLGELAGCGTLRATFRAARGWPDRGGHVYSDSVKLPTNTYDDHMTDRDVLLAIYEKFRTIATVAVVLSVFAVPLMILAIVRLL